MYFVQDYNVSSHRSYGEFTIKSQNNIVKFSGHNQSIRKNKMQNRLVAQNVIKTPLKGDTYFSINKKLLGYSTEQALKIKSFNKEGKQLQIKLGNNQTIKSFEFSSRNPWVYVCTSAGTLQIYTVNQQTAEVISKILSMKGVTQAKEINESVVLDCSDGFYRVLPFDVIIGSTTSNKKQLELEKLNALQKKVPASTVLQFQQNQNIYIKSTIPNTKQEIITVYSIKKTGKYQKTLQIDYIKNPVSLYRDRYVFNWNKQSTKNNISFLEIYDINEQKLIGKIDIEGDLKYAKIKQNMLLLILNTDNIDFYWFFCLNPKPDSTCALVTHKIIYQRGKGDYYDFCNMKSTESLNFTDKKKQQQLNDLLPQQIDNATTSIIYVLNRQKQKIEIIKLDHAKVLESPFKEEKIEKKVESNIVKNKIEGEKQQQKQQNQRVRIKSSLQHKVDGKTLEQTQKAFIQAIVDNKVRQMLSKFNQLEQRIDKLEKSMQKIHQKIELNMKSINKEQIRTSVQSLFEQLTPQFQKYFSELFKQVSGVLDQGVSFYNKKLAAEADIHKQALNQIVARTFEETEKVIEISKKEEKLSERSEKHLHQLLDARKKWQHKTEQFEQQSREATFTDTKVYRQPAERKVFVRTDLNQSARKQT